MGYRNTMKDVLSKMRAFTMLERAGRDEGYNKNLSSQRAWRRKASAKHGLQPGRQNPVIQPDEIEAHDEQLYRAYDSGLPRQAKVVGGQDRHHQASSDSYTEPADLQFNHSHGGGTLYHCLGDTNTSVADTRHDIRGNPVTKKGGGKKTISKDMKRRIADIRHEKHWKFRCIGDSHTHDIAARWFKLVRTKVATEKKKEKEVVLWVCLGRTFECSCPGMDKPRTRSCDCILWVKTQCLRADAPVVVNEYLTPNEVKALRVMKPLEPTPHIFKSDVPDCILKPLTAHREQGEGSASDGGEGGERTEDSTDYEVESFLAEEIVGGTLYALMKFAGYPDSDAEWKHATGRWVGCTTQFLEDKRAKMRKKSQSRKRPQKSVGGNTRLEDIHAMSYVQLTRATAGRRSCMGWHQIQKRQFTAHPPACDMGTLIGRGDPCFVVTAFRWNHPNKRYGPPHAIYFCANPNCSHKYRVLPDSRGDNAVQLVARRAPSNDRAQLASALPER